MNIAFIHYHLKPGGVTTVMRRQIDAVKDSCRTLVLTGEPPRGDFPADFVHVPGLGYTDPDRPAADPDRTAAAVCDAVSARWSAACDLIHVHNPTLAKNAAFLKILKSLQARGMKLFLQIHDFAEDGRPSAYFRDGYVEDCHYGVINSRDYAILLGSGLKEKGLHRIFNTVETEALPSDEPSSDRVLYPIRARRRKNIGEAILLSIFLPEKEIVSITLPPVSPVDLKSYMHWKDFVAQNRLTVQFDAGLGQDFDHLVRTAKYMITTSITEGFGFSFLEPWASGKFLWGRKLPQICSDFEERGVKLEHLYSELRVPLDWIGKDIFFKRWNACLQKNCMLFGFSLDPQEVRRDIYEKLTDERDKRRLLAALPSVEAKVEVASGIKVNPAEWNQTPPAERRRVAQATAQVLSTMAPEERRKITAAELERPHMKAATLLLAPNTVQGLMNEA
ncbi:MAG: glycosyltransferase family 1 protein, partial [Desulfobacteraceae bacterium]